MTRKSARSPATCDRSWAVTSMSAISRFGSAAIPSDSDAEPVFPATRAIFALLLVVFGGHQLERLLGQKRPGPIRQDHPGLSGLHPRNLEPGLVRNRPIAYAATSEATAQGAPAHRPQIGDIIGGTAMAGQPRPQQPPDVVREFASRTSLHLT